MSMNRNPDETVVIQPTVGFEGELGAIRFVFIKENKIYVIKGSEVLNIFTSTRKGVEGVNDNKSGPHISVLKKIAAEEKLLPPSKINFSHIFEFVTNPRKNPNNLITQFDEIIKIETHLIQYLLACKKTNPDLQLICISDWVKNYNLCFPEDKLPLSDQTDAMHILVDFSIKQLQLTPEQRNLSDTTKIAKDIQNQLKHYVQFNFVAAFGKKMGSMLVKICEENNSQPININKQKDILLRAENNAERACDFIRLQYNEKETKKEEQKLSKMPTDRKLIKLEGFFFILSMRILTETTYFQKAIESSDKNKYLFFLKTQLSDLIHSLSENDKALLKDISEWSDLQKNQLLALIAGSQYALTISYEKNGIDYTVKDVIESALGWNVQNPTLCNWFAGAPIKPFEPPLEPKGLHGKEPEQPLRRILLEYRFSERKTLTSAQTEMIKLLDAAAYFCKTTHLNIKDFSQYNHQQVLEFISLPVLTEQEKATFIQQIKLYNPALFNTLKSNDPTAIANFEKVQQSIEDKRHIDRNYSQGVDKNIALAMKLIRTPGKDDHLKNSLKNILFDEDTDTTLKQINYLFLLMNNANEIPFARRSLIQHQLQELYSEKILDSLTFPLKQFDEEYISYLYKNYAITETLPKVVEHLVFLSAFSKTNPEDFDFAIVPTEGGSTLTVEYLIKPNRIECIQNIDRENLTILDRACLYGIPLFVDALLKQGAKATTTSLIESYNHAALTPSLAKQLIEAGADPNKAFSSFAKARNLSKIVRMTKILGEQFLDNAIASLKDSEHVAELLEAKNHFVKENLNSFQSSDSTVALSHSVMFKSSPNDSKEPIPLTNSIALEPQKNSPPKNPRD